MEPKVETETDKTRALARLWAQMASKRATNPHVDRILSHLTRFYKDFWMMLDEVLTVFQFSIPKSSENPGCNLSNCDLWEGQSHSHFQSQQVDNQQHFSKLMDNKTTNISNWKSILKWSSGRRASRSERNFYRFC